ncbi:MAG: class I SAM-dependent methyltransferase [Betaproteobacteria bacterium]|nr:class I SAM-dependent methyltransferase [Betaproteobacteria bacterium]
MAPTKKELNKIALDYHGQDAMRDKFIEDLAQQYTFGWVFAQMAGCKTVLELGYGEGNFTKALVERGYTPEVLDGSDILLKKAQAVHGEKITVKCELFENFSPEEQYDCVLATHVLEHADAPVALLKRIKTWLAPGGKIIIIVPNKESIHRRLAVLMGLQPALDTLGERDNLVGHRRVYSLETLQKDAQAAGLAAVDSAGFFLKTIPNSMMLGYSRELLAALNEISPALPKNLLANIGMVCTAGGQQ